MSDIEPPPHDPDLPRETIRSDVLADLLRGLDGSGLGIEEKPVQEATITSGKDRVAELDLQRSRDQLSHEVRQIWDAAHPASGRELPAEVLDGVVQLIDEYALTDAFSDYGIGDDLATDLAFEGDLLAVRAQLGQALRSIQGDTALRAVLAGPLRDAIERAESEEDRNPRQREIAVDLILDTTRLLRSATGFDKLAIELVRYLAPELEAGSTGAFATVVSIVGQHARHVGHSPLDRVALLDLAMRGVAQVLAGTSGTPIPNLARVTVHNAAFSTAGVISDRLQDGHDGPGAPEGVSLVRDLKRVSAATAPPFRVPAALRPMLTPLVVPAGLDVEAQDSLLDDTMIVIDDFGGSPTAWRGFEPYESAQLEAISAIGSRLAGTIDFVPSRFYNAAIGIERDLASESTDVREQRWRGVATFGTLGVGWAVTLAPDFGAAARDFDVLACARITLKALRRAGLAPDLSSAPPAIAEYVRALVGLAELPQITEAGMRVEQARTQQEARDIVGDGDFGDPPTPQSLIAAAAEALRVVVEPLQVVGPGADVFSELEDLTGLLQHLLPAVAPADFLGGELYWHVQDAVVARQDPVAAIESYVDATAAVPPVVQLAIEDATRWRRRVNRLHQPLSSITSALAYFAQQGE